MDPSIFGQFYKLARIPKPEVKYISPTHVNLVICCSNKSRTNLSIIGTQKRSSFQRTLHLNGFSSHHAGLQPVLVDPMDLSTSDSTSLNQERSMMKELRIITGTNSVHQTRRLCAAASVKRFGQSLEM